MLSIDYSCTLLKLRDRPIGSITLISLVGNKNGTEDKRNVRLTFLARTWKVVMRSQFSATVGSKPVSSAKLLKNFCLFSIFSQCRLFSPFLFEAFLFSPFFLKKCVNIIATIYQKKEKTFFKAVQFWEGRSQCLLKISSIQF